MNIRDNTVPVKTVLLFIKTPVDTTLKHKVNEVFHSCQNFFYPAAAGRVQVMNATGCVAVAFYYCLICYISSFRCLSPERHFMRLRLKKI
jgi:hypothetical protein